MTKSSKKHVFNSACCARASSQAQHIYIVIFLIKLSESEPSGPGGVADARLALLVSIECPELTILVYAAFQSLC